MKKNGKNSGQVLVMGLVMVLILLFAIFFFFDIHNVIRGKIKLENAEQAAALAAARWQAESLNLIGEINLLLATENVLLSDTIAVPDSDIFKDLPEDTPYELQQKEIRRAQARVMALNEMQSRISFIGPLIALASAQQTAKQNGIAVVKYPDNHLARDFEQYQRRLENPNSSIYMNNNTVHGYSWKTPYRQLISEIQQNGPAVRPGAMVVGIEGIQPSYLADESLYSAIIACSKGYPAWCHWRLRQLIKMDDSFFEGTDWHSPDFSWIRFSQQSEIYPLEVTLNNNIADNYENFRDFAGNFGYSRDTDNGSADQKTTMSLNDALKYHCRFYQYNHRWFETNTTYSGPDTSELSPWRRGIYLRKNIAEFAKYGGPTAYAECVGRVPSVMTFKSNYSFSQSKNIASGKASLEKAKPLVRQVEYVKTDPGVRVGGNYSADYQNSGSVAKPIGSLGDLPPTALPIVLPVFYRANLIPSSMQLVRIFSFQWPPVEKFIVALKDILDDEKSIYDEDLPIPAGTEYMLEALRLLGSKEFRRKGWNPDFKEGNYSTEALIKMFDKDTKLYDPVNNPNGPGWLQQPAVHYGRNYNIPDEARKDSIYYYTGDIANKLNEEIERKNKTLSDKNKLPLYIVPPAGETWIFFEGRYIRSKGDSLFESMEKDPYVGCGTIHRGNGGTIAPGTNSGPPRL